MCIDYITVFSGEQCGPWASCLFFQTTFARGLIYILIFFCCTATNVALDILSQQVKGQRIPDQHGSSGAVTFDISR